MVLRNMTQTDVVENLKQSFTIFNAVKMAHEGQTRADGVTPYFTHPMAVATMVRLWGGSDTAVKAALSHDVLEDCAPDKIEFWQEMVLMNVPEREAEQIFLMVEALTKPGPQSGLNRASRGRIAIEKILAAAIVEPEVVLVKLADRLHNLTDMSGKHATFKPIYQRETQEILEALTPIAVENGWEEYLEAVAAANDRLT